MAADNDVLDPQDVDGKLDRRQAIEVRVYDNVRDIALPEHVAWQQTDDLVRGDPAVRTADPQIARRLLLRQTRKERRILPAHLLGPGAVVGKKIFESTHARDTLSEGFGRKRKRRLGSRTYEPTTAPGLSHSACCEPGLALEQSAFQPAQERVQAARRPKNRIPRSDFRQRRINDAQSGDAEWPCRHPTPDAAPFRSGRLRSRRRETESRRTPCSPVPCSRPSCSRRRAAQRRSCPRR